MDIVVIFHGLGNQMSQYAFFLQRKSINKSTYYISHCTQHNGLELTKVFNIHLKETIIKEVLFFICKILLTKKFKIILRPIQIVLNLLSFRLVSEGVDYKFNSNYLQMSNKKGVTFYYGGWHNENYFSSIRQIVLNKYKFNKPCDEENIYHIDNIINSDSVSIHVRRGDYLNNINFDLFGDVCSKQYYEHAINLIKIKVSNPRFYVFSNDISWVKSNLEVNNVTYVTCNTAKDSWKDMYLMSLCKHNIIANSTFSWWGAWLNQNLDKVVICPTRFIKGDIPSDIYPDSWIKIPDFN